MALKRLGKRAGKAPAPQPAAPHNGDGVLPPRLDQTLHLLLAGHSEKQIAAQLGLSRNTVHHYVKDLYKRFGVSSRAELMARWVHRDGQSHQNHEPAVKRRPSRHRAASSRRPKRVRATSGDA